MKTEIKKLEKSQIEVVFELTVQEFEKHYQQHIVPLLLCGQQPAILVVAVLQWPCRGIKNMMALIRQRRRVVEQAA